MKGGGGGTARLGLQVHEHQIGDPGPVDEMRKVQDRRPAPASRAVHRHHRKRVEDTLGSIHLHGDGGEPSPAGRGAAHRPQEGGRIGRGERVLDEPGGLPVGLKRDLRFFERRRPRSSIGSSPLSLPLPGCAPPPPCGFLPPGGGPGTGHPGRVRWLPPRPPRSLGCYSARNAAEGTAGEDTFTDPDTNSPSPVG